MIVASTDVESIMTHKNLFSKVLGTVLSNFSCVKSCVYLFFISDVSQFQKIVNITDFVTFIT